MKLSKLLKYFRKKFRLHYNYLIENIAGFSNEVGDDGIPTGETFATFFAVGDFAFETSCAFVAFFSTIKSVISPFFL